MEAGEPPFRRNPLPQGTPDIGEYGALMLLPLLFSLTTSVGRDLFKAKTGRFVWDTEPDGFRTCNNYRCGKDERVTERLYREIATFEWPFYRTLSKAIKARLTPKDVQWPFKSSM